MTENRSLFQSVKVGAATLANRVGVAPMTRTSATPDGRATAEMVRYYAKFARGGFGLIITEGAYPDNRYSQGYLNQPGLIDDEQVRAWKAVTDAVHQAGAKIFVQLMHAGALSQGNRFTEQTIAPSAVPPRGEQMKAYGGEGGFPIPREATKADIQDVIRGFADSAQRAKQAGFDGVEIHGANGYLLDQFLTDYTNQRNDEYGGSTENRVRLLVEVVQAVREAVGPDYPMGIRISQGKIIDYHHKWANKEKDAAIIFGQLGRAGVDYIHVTEFEAWQPAFLHEEGTGAWEPAFDGTGLTLAALAKKFGQVPVMANGSLHDPRRAREIIEQGEVDLITLGRGALANGDWVHKVRNGEPLEEFDPARFLAPTATIKGFEAPSL